MLTAKLYHLLIIYCIFFVFVSTTAVETREAKELCKFTERVLWIPSKACDKLSEVSKNHRKTESKNHAGMGKRLNMCKMIERSRPLDLL